MNLRLNSYLDLLSLHPLAGCRKYFLVLSLPDARQTTNYVPEITPGSCTGDYYHTRSQNILKTKQSAQAAPLKTVFVMTVGGGMITKQV